MDSTSSTAKVCSHKHSFSLDNFLRKLVQPPKKILSPYIKSGDTAVDIGCGPGFFTTAMAELVGPTGQVHAIDLQQEMLEKLAAKLNNSPFQDRVQLHKCNSDSIATNSTIEADFILAYYMVHETVDQRSFFREARKMLRQDGRMLIVEPPFHVKKSDFKESQRIAQEEGFTLYKNPKRKGGMSMLIG